ncbi:hypothetical protein PMI02_00602 [Novosphingobium sp. AP12]|nr:hypothetical protein PMI02_00602 [Novosphingobium sp. AP12]
MVFNMGSDLSIHGIGIMLNDVKVKAAKAKENAYKIADSGSLCLNVSITGVRSWRMNYTFGRNAQGKPQQKNADVRHLPGMMLLQARARRDDAKALLAEGRGLRPRRSLPPSPACSSTKRLSGLSPTAGSS